MFKKLPAHTKQEIAQIDPQKASWKGVLEAVKHAVDQHGDLSHLSEPARVARVGLVTICNRSGMFEKWLNLLPSGDYGSSISGAFLLLIKVCIPRKMFQTFAETLPSERLLPQSMRQRRASLLH